MKPHPAFFPAEQQTAFLEDLEVVDHGRLRNRKHLGEVAQPQIAVQQTLDVPEASRVGERTEHGTQVLVEHLQSVCGTPKMTQACKC